MFGKHGFKGVFGAMFVSKNAALGLVLKLRLANTAIEAPRAAFICKNAAIGLGI